MSEVNLRSRWHKVVLWGFSGLAVLALAMFILMTWVYDLTTVQGDDMWPTMGPDSLVLVRRGKVPHRGDLVMMKSDEGRWQIRRVVGEAGDKIAILDCMPIVAGEKPQRTELRKLQIGGRAARIMRETVGGRSHEVVDILGSTGVFMPETIVPSGHYYVMADNREDRGAPDSRLYGPVPKDRIRGVVTWIVKTGKVP